MSLVRLVLCFALLRSSAALHTAMAGRSSIDEWMPSDSSDSEERTSRSKNRSRTRSRSKSRSTSVELDRADTMRSLSGPSGQASLPAPPSVPGTEWWARILYTASEHLRVRLPAAPKRAMTHESLLAGLGTEMFGARVLGINMTTTVAVDKKPAAKKWLAKHAPWVKHIFSELEDATNASGACCMHGGKSCTLSGRPDLVTIGLPCQPFTYARDSRTCSPKNHSLYPVTFEMFFDYLRDRKPLGFIAEEVLGFGRTDMDTGSTYLEEFCNKCAGLGFAIRVHQLSASVWLDAERDRCLPFLDRWCV